MSLVKVLSDEKFVKEVSHRYLEVIFNKKKHQDVIHAMVTGSAWEMFLSDVAQVVGQYKSQGKSDKFIGAYVAERTRCYAETFLNYLHERVGTDAIIEEGLVRDPSDERD